MKGCKGIKRNIENMLVVYVRNRDMLFAFFFFLNLCLYIITLMLRLNYLVVIFFGAENFAEIFFSEKTLTFFKTYFKVDSGC